MKFIDYLIVAMWVLIAVIWLLPEQKAEAQLGMTPIWQQLTISGHRYIIIKYKDSVGITHDESCTAK